MKSLTATVVLLLAGAIILSASTVPVTLIGNPIIPGFVTLDVNGVDYQALDYTGDRYAFQGETWQADVVTASLLPTEGYYSPNDPVTMYSNYLTLYTAWDWLFLQLQTHPADASKIQDAVYYLSDPTGPYESNSWVTAALAAAGGGSAPLSPQFEYIDSPLAKGTTLVQGFIIEVPDTVRTPEPTTLLLTGIGVFLVGILRRKAS